LTAGKSLCLGTSTVCAVQDCALFFIATESRAEWWKW